MTDYQLERLNTRSFEQLIQALGLQIIGSQLQVFGDGPDGGREATFDGPVKYPEGKTQWNGFGMVQAKFRQFPDSSAKKNADWALAQLRAEFKKLVPRPKTKGKIKVTPGDRVCPEFYVFATNLSFSSVAKSGGKDRIQAALDEFKKSHGLRGYAIWDGDQIRRFLDTFPNVRATYAAWLLPGDVLTEMMRYLKLHETDFAQTIRRYLESELLDDQYAKLGQGGYTDANTISLSSVFVDLPIENGTAAKLRLDAPSPTELAERHADAPERQRRHTFLEVFLEEGRQVLRPSSSLRSVVGNGASDATAGRLVLIGGPGQGKTTLGQFACQLLRAALLQRAGATYSPEVAQALLRIAQQTGDLPQVSVLRYPLRIDLKKLAEALAGTGDLSATSVLDYLVRHIAKRTDSTLTKTEFRAWLRAYPWLLVLDGLDEVPASSNRAKMMDAIRDFVSVEANQQDADLMILATTRPQGYSDEFNPALYFHIPLAPLAAEEAMEYGVRLTEARHPGLKARIEELVASLKRATANPATVRLMESPLQVTIMLALIEGGGEPPEQRWKLFHDYYDVIYRREKERGTPFSTILGKYEPDIHWLHHRAGWILQQQNAAAGATGAKLSHSEFERLVGERLLRRGHEDSAKREELVTRIRVAATDRLVFLVGNTANEIGFEIRSLQEFMAAEHVFDGSEACVQATSRAIAPHPYWRNVFLFVAGRIFFEKESLIDSLVVTCERLNESLSDAAQGYVMAGSRLALAMLKDGAARNQPENVRVLARCASKLLDSIDPNEAADLLDVFGGEASEVFKEELAKRLQNGGIPILGWRLCLDLISLGDAWAVDLMRNCFPWKDVDVEKLVKRAFPDPKRIPALFWEEFRPYLYVHSPGVWTFLFRADELPQCLDFEPVNSLHAIFSTRQASHRAPLLDDDGRRTCNALTYEGETGRVAWQKLQIDTSAPDCHPQWLVFAAVADFAKEPTQESLIRILNLGASRGKDEPLRAFGFYGPWQLAACLAALDAGMPLDGIVAAIGRGALGTTHDWSEWAMKDHDQGIKIAALGFPSGLMSVSHECLGAVYGNSGWSHSGGGATGADLVFARALTGALPALKADSKIAELLVGLCCFGLSGPGVQLQGKGARTVEDFVLACEAFGVLMSREIVPVILATSVPALRKAELLAAVGGRIEGQSWMRRWDQLAPDVDTQSREVLASKARPEVLRMALMALSFIPPTPFAASIPQNLLDDLAESGSDGRLAAAALTGNGANWGEERAPSFATELWGIQAKYPQHLRELMGHVESTGKHGAHLERFFLELLAICGQASIAPKLSELLVKLVERRPAIRTLPDPSCRSASSEGGAKI